VGYLKTGDKVCGNFNIIGNIEDLKNVLNGTVIDEVVFAIPSEYKDSILLLIKECKDRGKTVHIVTEFFNLPVAM
jgi:hypothetical protein